MRRRGKRGDIQLRPTVGGCASPLAQREAGERGDAHQPSLDAVGPRLVVGAPFRGGHRPACDQPGGRRLRQRLLRRSGPCAGHHVWINEVNEHPGRALDIGDRDCGSRTGFDGE